MKKTKSVELLDQQQSYVRKIIATTTLVRQEDPELLLRPPAPGKWSVIQTLEHLNSYGRYYLPAIENAMKESKSSQEWFSPGWLGNYFTNMMLPKNGVVTNKMQAPKDHRPSSDLDVKPVMDEFLKQQNQLLDLLEAAKKKNIGAIRVPISISKILKLKLGDTSRFFVAHEQRHLVQVHLALQACKSQLAKV